MTTVDFLATVDAFPKPDDKVRSTSLMIEGGGNAGNALTCAARLGLKPRLISKVADDPHGFAVLKEKTRPSIYTPGDPPMMPDDLSQSTLLSAFDRARLVYFDGMFPETALFVAQEAARNNIPILVEAESPTEGLEELLKLADFVTCSAKFPQAWTQAPSIPSALVSMLL